MAKEKNREVLDNAMMEINAIKYRRANGLVMCGFVEIGDREGIKVVIETDFGTYDKHCNVITLTDDGKFKVNIVDRVGNPLDVIEKENKAREGFGAKPILTEFEDIVSAIELGYEVVNYWEFEDEYDDED